MCLLIVFLKINHTCIVNVKYWSCSVKFECLHQNVHRKDNVCNCELYLSEVYLPKLDETNSDMTSLPVFLCSTCLSPRFCLIMSKTEWGKSHFLSDFYVSFRVKQSMNICVGSKLWQSTFSQLSMESFNHSVVCVCPAEIGMGLTGFGVFFLFFGMILFFDKALLAIGNVSVSASLTWCHLWCCDTGAALCPPHELVLTMIRILVIYRLMCSK